MLSRWSFVGREDELGRLRALIAAGLGALLVGEAGVGKSALVSQAAQRAVATGQVSAVTHIVGHAVVPAEPFSAFAGLIPARSVELVPTEVARLVTQAAARRGSAPLLFVVDDIDLIDERSAQVLLQLAHQKAAIILATSRSGAGPVAVTRLWHEGLCERIELAALGEPEVAAVLAVALDGELSPELAEAFAVRSQGNPLLLRELLGAALDSRTLRLEEGAWRLVGDAPVPGGVGVLIDARLAALPGAWRAGLEMIAASEPCPLQIADDIVGTALLTELESARLVAVTSGLAGQAVTTAHPLYGEVLRSGLSSLRRRQLNLTLASRLQAQAQPSPHELVWAAQWRIDNDLPEEPERLLAAARAARAFSFATAQRLARRAYETSPSMEATLLLADILTNMGRADEAVALTSALPPESLSDAAREAVVYCGAMLRGWQAGDTAAGAALVDAALNGDHEASDTLRGLQAFLLAFDGRVEEALSIGTAMLTDPAATPPARGIAGLGVIFAEHRVGHFDRAVALANELRPLAQSLRAAIPWLAGRMEVVALFALTEAGHYERAAERGAAMLREARAEGDAAGVPVAQGCLARTVLRQGKPATAIRLARDSLARLSPFDDVTRRPIGALLARSLAIVGQLEEARAALAVGAEAPKMKVWEPEISRALAAVSAAELNMVDAIEHVAWAARVAAEQRAWGTALRCYHDAARYGDANQVLAPIRHAAAHVDGPLAPVMVAHTEALATSDASGLDHVAGRFVELGDVLTGAESSAAAALAHAALGDTRAAAASGNRAAELLAQCEGAVLPWLAGGFGPGPAALTTREREIATLMAAGCSYGEIASKLFISPRTVQTHLTNVYRKLNISGRAELAERLDPRKQA